MTEIKHNSLKRKYLYHITQSNVPETNFVWTPRTIGSNRCDFEPRIPRICFSTNLSGCFVALGECLVSDKDIHVLKTVKPVHYYSPSATQVTDVEITEEVWRLKPVSLCRVALLTPSQISSQEIKIHDYLKFNAGTKEVLPWQIIAKSAVNKIINNLKM